MLNFRATFAHIKTQIGTKIKNLAIATMFGEAAVYLSDWTDKPLLSAVFVIYNCRTDAGKR